MSYVTATCLTCGDSWQEDERPIVCPECASRDVREEDPAREAYRCPSDGGVCAPVDDHWVCLICGDEY